MNYRNQSTDRLFQAILSLKTTEECYRFFEDACTVKEILDIAQRFEAACMLDEKQSYQEINREIGISSATIGRVSRSLLYGAGGYRLVIDRLKESENEGEAYGTDR